MKNFGKIAIAAGVLSIFMIACGSKSAETNSAEGIETGVVSESAKSDDVVVALAADALPVAGEKPVVVDCWATWCGPCMQFKPVFHKVAEAYASKADFMTADVDQCVKVVEEYQISAIPTVILLKAGQEPVVSTGSMTEDEFKAWLNENL